MRIETAVGIYAGVKQQANVIAVRKNAIHEFPAKLAEFFFSAGIPEQVLAALADGDIGVHAAAVHADDWLGQEGGRHPQLCRDFAADQFVDLDLVGGGDNFSVAVVDFELRRSDFRVVFFVLETHSALHFGGCVNECAQGIAGQRVVVAAGVHVFEFAGFLEVALGVGAFKEEAFNFVGGVERVALLGIQRFRIALQNAANIGCVGATL